MIAMKSVNALRAAPEAHIQDYLVKRPVRIIEHFL